MSSLLLLLVGIDSIKGVLKKKINPDTIFCEFKDLEIQCVKEENYQESLNERREILVDPFYTGRQSYHPGQRYHRSQLRLAFQVFLKPQHSATWIPVLDIPVTRVIKDESRNMKIIDCSDNKASFEGNIARYFHEI